MDNYVRILEEVEAVKATETNIKDLEAIAGRVQKIHPSSNTSYYIVQGVSQVLWVGDWLIKHKSGRMEVKSDKLFHQEYESK